jgi:rod shape-determining protein MreB
MPGARKVWLIDEPMAAAIGADLPVTDPMGSMVVDIGGGSTEVGVLSVGGMSTSLSSASAATRWTRRSCPTCAATTTCTSARRPAERVKKDAGSAIAEDEEVVITVRGRDAVRGVPREVSITRANLAEALGGPVAQIVGAVRRALEETAPEIAADILDQGIVMTGGGSLLHGIDVMLSRVTGLPVRVADDPLNCVALGAGRALEENDYRGVLHAA